MLKRVTHQQLDSQRADGSFFRCSLQKISFRGVCKTDGLWEVLIPAIVKPYAEDPGTGFEFALVSDGKMIIVPLLYSQVITIHISVEVGIMMVSSEREKHVIVVLQSPVRCQ